MICEMNCIWNLACCINAGQSLMGLRMCQKNCIPIFLAAHFFLCMLPIPSSSPSNIFPARDVLQFSKRRYRRNSKLPGCTAHCNNPHPTAPIILNGTETLQSACVRAFLSIHQSTIVPTFLSDGRVTSCIASRASKPRTWPAARRRAREPPRTRMVGSLWRAKLQQ